MTTYPVHVEVCCDEAPYCDYCGEARVVWMFRDVGACDACKAQAVADYASLGRCGLCSCDATQVITSNMLLDARTLAVMGGPVCLDQDGPSQVGTVLCDHHGAGAAETGYTLRPLTQETRP